MTSLDELERSALNVRQIHAELDLSMNSLLDSLIVPGVAMPTMKVVFGGQRSPALRFRQFVFRSQVSRQDLFDQRMQSEIDKTLIEQQDILDHVPVEFGPLIAFKVVPAYSAKAALKRQLHPAQFFWADNGRDAVGV